MAHELEKCKMFAKEVLARISGNDTEATANKIARKSLFAVESQISGLKSALNDKKDELEDKREAVENAIYPASVFETGKAYIEGISRANLAYDQLKEEVADLESQLAFWEKVLEERFKE